MQHNLNGCIKALLNPKDYLIGDPFCKRFKTDAHFTMHVCVCVCAS